MLTPLEKEITMNTFTPIFLSESHCPECGREEDIKKVCAHCGYRYEEENTGDLKEYVLVFILVVLGASFIGVIVDWLVSDMTLIDRLGDYWEWITSSWEWIASRRIW